VTLVAWNGTVDVTKAAGDSRLDRAARLRIEGLADGSHRLRHRRLDERHSNLVRSWMQLGGEADWPSGEQWIELAERDALEELEPERTVETVDGRIELSFELPMPAISLIELTPA